jgi:glutamate-1-semialdehyde 2,1-aminomutase
MKLLLYALNDKDAVLKAFEDFKDQIAVVIIEPIPANNGLLLQTQDYLDFLRETCTKTAPCYCLMK